MAVIVGAVAVVGVSRAAERLHCCHVATQHVVGRHAAGRHVAVCIAMDGSMECAHGRELAVA